VAPASPLPGLQQLPRRWAGRSRFVILDSDFADGARFLAVLALWRADPHRPARLHYVALTAVPLAAPPAGALAELPTPWPAALPGLHRIALEREAVLLDLLVGPPATSLGQLGGAVDAFYLEPLPALRWSATVLAKLAAPAATLVAAPGALDAAQQGTLARAGFVFDGSRAVRAGPAPSAGAAPPRRAIVIGAGLAGAAACERLAARGWSVTLLEREAGPALQASGNLAGIVMPLLARDENPSARLSRAAYLYALRQFERLGGIGQRITGASCGVLQLVADAGEAELQRRSAARAAYPPDYARWLEPAAASALLGRPAHGGWLFAHGGWVNPASLCRTLLDACGGALTRRYTSTALALRRSGDEWQVLAADGAVLASAPTVILANGTGATGLAQAAGLPLAAVRGQVTHVVSGVLPQPPLVVCGAAYMTPPSGGLVCVGASYDDDGDPQLRADSQHDNLVRIAAMLGVPVPQVALAGRTGFRCVAPDRLPLVGPLPDPQAAWAASGQRRGGAEHLADVARWPGLYGLLGYASRGLIWAPLAAELLAAQLDGAPPPLEASLVAALDPARFLLKQLRRNHADGAV